MIFIGIQSRQKDNGIRKNERSVKKMVAVKEATHATDHYQPMGSTEILEIHTPIFRDHEISKAETIVAELEGLTIESAKELLHKVEMYIEQCEIPKQGCS